MLRSLTYALLVVLAAACTRSKPEEPHPSTPRAASAPALAKPSPAVEAGAARPKNWAEPLQRAGLPNLFRVSDGYYRGAQPTADGIRELPKLGVHTIVNLRSMHDDDDDEIGDLPLRYEQIRFTAWHPEHEDVVRFLKIVTTAKNQPIFVHCQYGADRTGMMTAIYRITVQGWKKDDAIREMTEGGFGFHPEWQNLVDFVRELDVDALRREAGIPAPK
jgi:protein tyrosine phosphatase (PTP) superfamily phosphohydrolase (DUF442 family)